MFAEPTLGHCARCLLQWEIASIASVYPSSALNHAAASVRWARRRRSLGLLTAPARFPPKFVG